jgi:hypothetical protein
MYSVIHVVTSRLHPSIVRYVQAVAWKRICSAQLYHHDNIDTPVIDLFLGWTLMSHTGFSKHRTKELSKYHEAQGWAVVAGGTEICGVPF